MKISFIAVILLLIFHTCSFKIDQENNKEFVNMIEKENYKDKYSFLGKKIQSRI